MSVTVKTFARLADAAGALSSERGARFLAGGTLVMRAVNEADPAIETIVRSTDPTFCRTFQCRRAAWSSAPASPWRRSSPSASWRFCIR